MSETKSEYAIEATGIVMEFGGVRALDGVDFRLKNGEVMGLVGKNGAGKSTLMKIINGVYTHTDGALRFFGKNIEKNTPIAEREKTVSMIYQDYSLVGEMSVAQNIFMHCEPIKNGLIDDRACIAAARDFFKTMGLAIDPLCKVGSLSTGDMQLVEIAKAIIKKTSVILMDEPTAALDAEATEKFFEIINKLKSEGYSIVISTHHLRHIVELCDSVTVVRDGKTCMDKSLGDTSLEEIIAAMLGESGFHAQKLREKREFDTKNPLLSVKSITSAALREPVSLELYPGEVLGLAGVKGSGRTEIFNCIYGIDPARSGKILVDNKPAKISSPGDAIKNKIFLVPENRHTQGLSLMHSLYDNALLPILPSLACRRPFIDDKRGAGVVDNIINTMRVKTPGRDVIIGNLSGGNQQKVVVGKAMESSPRVIMMDDPTYGVDIHAKGDIAASIERFTAQGNAVLFASSELSELIENCDRILIIKYNRIVGEIRDVPSAGLTEDGLMAAIQ